MCDRVVSLREILRFERKYNCSLCNGDQGECPHPLASSDSHFGRRFRGGKAVPCVITAFEWLVGSVLLTSEEGRSLGVERRNFGGCDAPRWERDLLDSRVTRSGRGGYLSAGVRTPVCAEVMTVTEASDSYDVEESDVRKADVVGSERLWRKQVGLVEGP